MTNVNETQASSGSYSAFPPDPTRLDMRTGTICSETLLLQELTHRVTNDWTSAICAVSTAARSARNRQVKSVLENVAGQLYRHAELLRALQIPSENTLADVAEYLHRLCLSISRSKLDWMSIRLTLAADPLLMETERCWRLGMIVYELVTNAARHAFRDQTGGSIRVDLCCADTLVLCKVSDNGSAPAHVQPGKGLTIVRELVRSLGGQFEQTFGQFGSTTIVQVVA